MLFFSVQFLLTRYQCVKLLERLSDSGIIENKIILGIDVDFGNFYGWTDRRTDTQTFGRTNGRLEGRTDSRMNGRNSNR